MAASARRFRLGSIAIGALAVVAVLVALQLVSVLPHLSNPFRTEEKDRTGPAVLKSLSDLSDYHASTAELQVLVDVEKDAKYVPAFIRGEHVIYQAVGSVDGVVDLSDLSARTVKVSADGKRVRITLPEPQLSRPHLDPRRSRTVSRSRGVLDRIGSAFTDNPSGERSIQIAAEKKLAAAARETGLRQRAEKNTRIMLRNLLRGAGVDQVDVRFTQPPHRPQP